MATSQNNNLNKNETLWINDPSIFFQTSKLLEVWPKENMSHEQKINAISRCVIYLTELQLSPCEGPPQVRISSVWGPKSVFHAQQLSLSWREQIIKLGREFIVRIDLENQTRFSIVSK